jgi:hypothetical protein
LDDVFDTSVKLDKEIVMSEMYMKDKKSKLSFGCETLLGALVLAVLAGLGTTGYAAASGSKSQALPPDKISIFDPFTLSCTIVTAGEISGSGSVNSGRFGNDIDGMERLWRNVFGKPTSAGFHSHLIRIPLRPVLRSPFRPPFIPPGPPSGVPGRPVWAPPGRPW